MLHLKKVLGAKPKEHTEAKLAVLHTPWGEALDPAHVLEEHPEPQFARESFSILNGTWKCAFVENGYSQGDDVRCVVEQAHCPAEAAFTQDIVVPFSPEAPLSGVGRQLKPGELLWYSRSFEAPALESQQRLLLHFQAVDYACSIRVNGQLVGTHVGGYVPFALDVTDYLRPGKNQLAVCVADPSEQGAHVRGKQRLDRGDIWYTAQSGIWQTVWTEVVPAARIDSIAIDADLATGIVAVGARLALPAQALEGASVPGALKLEVLDPQGTCVAVEEVPVEGASAAVAAHVGRVEAWSPASPRLYVLKLTYGDDVVTSYCGFRTIEMRVSDATSKGTRGVRAPRIFLNGEPLFIKGVLDQAYWSDGLMTAPSDEALVYDIQAMRADGFNLMRKHIKLEAARWYYHCDRAGMLVLQDMVSGGDHEIKSWQWSYKPTLFKPSWRHYRDDTAAHRSALGAGDEAYKREWRDTCHDAIRVLGNHPCIIGWSLFNEGWGQFDAKAACESVRLLDPSRLVDATSGWYDQGCGDFNSVHNYFRDMKVWRDLKAGKGAQRAFFISEFGGYTHRVEGHAALDEAYGYEPYDDCATWRKAVRDLLVEVEALEPKGLVGYIYTQVSDIEEETNGILTYDRRINKFADSQ